MPRLCSTGNLEALEAMNRYKEKNDTLQLAIFYHYVKCLR